MDVQAVSAKQQQHDLAEHYADRCNEIFNKDAMTEDDRIEIETLCAIAIELIKNAAPSVVREAGRIVEIRSYKDRMR